MRKEHPTRFYGFVTLLAASLIAAGSHAAVVVTIEDGINGMTAVGTGTLNITQSDSFVNSNTTNNIRADAAVTVGPHSSTTAELHTITTNFAGPSNIGPGNFSNSGNIGSGDLFGINFSPIDNFINPRILLLVPDGYQSGSQLDGQSFHQNKTIEQAGLTPGTYVWTWGTGAAADSYTVIVTPEPSSLALLGLGGLLIGRRWRG